MKPTQKNIRKFFYEKLSSDPSWALRGLEVVYSMQTYDEKITGETTYKDFKGFNAFDSKVLTRIAKRWIYSRRIHSHELQTVFSRMPKYWKQLYGVSDKGMVKGMIIALPKVEQLKLKL